MSAPEPIDVVFSFDTTGSMYPAFTQVRRQVGETCKRLYEQIPGLHIGIITHGDYCDGSKVLTMQDLTDDAALVTDFVKTAPSTSGGDYPECYEYVLHKARSMAWRAGKSKILVMIGDATPHGPTYPQNTMNLDWRNELKLLVEGGINVYAVQCLDNRSSRSFWAEMAKLTSGYHLELHQFSAINDLVMATCYRQQSPEAFQAFEVEVEKAGRMSDAVGACFDVMAERPVRDVRSRASVWSGYAKSASVVATGDVDVAKLKPVPPSRFQVLDVDKPSPIKDFVNDNGLKFAVGRGFYEFTKTVTVQPRKEVVLVQAKTGAMFSGDDARTMIGLPAMGSGGNVRLRPGTLPGFAAFIQSTSWNRKLLAGTKFLYEVEEEKH